MTDNRNSPWHPARFRREQIESHIAQARFAIARLTAEQIVVRMADRIVDFAAQSGACTEDDIKAMGFADEVMVRHLPAAKKLARRIAPQLQGGLA